MLLSSKDKSSLWHIQSAFTQGLKSYIYSTKMFKLTLQHPSSEKLIVLFVQQQKTPHFLNYRCKCTHTYIPPPSGVHPTASTLKRTHENVCKRQYQAFKYCSCLYKHNFVLSYVQPMQWMLQVFCRNIRRYNVIEGCITTRSPRGTE